MEEEMGRVVALISLVQVEEGNWILSVEVTVRVLVGVSDMIIVLLGFPTVVGVNVTAQLVKKPAVKVTVSVPVPEVSSPIVPEKPEIVIAGLGLITLPITTTVVLT
jgi:hypothetical protein